LNVEEVSSILIKTGPGALLLDFIGTPFDELAQKRLDSIRGITTEPIGSSGVSHRGNMAICPRKRTIGII